MPKLTPRQQFMINQVAATMEIENMPLTERAYNNLVEIVTGEKTAEEVIEEIKTKYTTDE